MTNPFLTEVDGWTPIIEVIAQEVGLIPAAVYGVVWRYCQGEKRVCYATLETMAGKLGVNAATVQRHIKTLCDAGYLEDTTPGLRNKSHTYKDTGRVEIMMLVHARVAERNVAPEPAPDCTPQPDIAQRNVTLQPATSHCRNDVEESPKIEKRVDIGEKMARPRRAAPKQRDARFEHPAIQAIRTVTGKTPNKDTWDVLIARVHTPVDVPRLTECWQAWRMRNYSPVNLSGLLDWYDNGIPRNGANRAGSLAGVDAAIDQYLREEAASGNS